MGKYLVISIGVGVGNESEDIYKVEAFDNKTVAAEHYRNLRDMDRYSTKVWLVAATPLVEVEKHMGQVVKETIHDKAN